MRFLLILSVLVLSACSSEPVANTDFEKKKTEPAKVLTEEELAARAEEERRAEAERLSNEANSLLEKLNQEFKQANSDWKKTSDDVASESDYEEHLKNRPCLQFAEQLVGLAKKYPDTKAAESAWYLAAKYGEGNSKSEAANQVLDAAREDDDPARVQSRLELLMAHCDGQVQEQAMGDLLDIATEDINSDSSFEIVKKLASCPTAKKIADDGAVIFPGNESVRQKAVRQLKLLAQIDMKSEKSVECLDLLVKFGPEQTQDAAIRQLMAHHLDHPTTCQIARDLSEDVSQRNEDFLNDFINKSSGKTRVNAVVALARFYSNRQREAQLLGMEEGAAVDDEQKKYLKEEIDTERLDALEEMLATYVDDHEEMLTLAKRELFAIRKLAVGQSAPEISAEDLEGSEFKLSEYRGKLVLLCFWGDWCEDCQADYDHYRSLVQQLDGKPFVIVGVNSDPSREHALQLTKDENLSWRNFWNGSEGKDGPISTDWCVNLWPTTYLIDKEGVIRRKNLQGAVLDKAIEALMKEMGEEISLGNGEQQSEGSDSPREPQDDAPPAPDADKSDSTPTEEESAKDSGS